MHKDMAGQMDFGMLAAPFQGELKRHCYRMMGGIQDAEDCLQETLLRGWQEFGTLRQIARLRPWLFAIATRVCLDALRGRKRRQVLFGPSLDELAPSTDPWVEPYPGAAPSERAEDLRLIFVSLLQNLSPQSRAVLLLHDGVGMTTPEIAQALGIGAQAARSALQRARGQVTRRPAIVEDPALAEPYIAAWNAGHVEGLIALLRRDIVMTMPPWRRTFVGRDEVAEFLRMVWPRYARFHARATFANGQPAVALYALDEAGTFRPHSLHVLDGENDLAAIVLYAPPLGAALFPAFDLPMQIAPGDGFPFPGHLG